MISYFMLGTNDLPAAVKFYDALMVEMGAIKAYQTERNAGWGLPMRELSV